MSTDLAFMKPLNIKKLYYSISEVSEMTSLKPYVLRYWESEFPQLKPSKNRAGNRIYRNSDIEIIRSIKRLLYTEKYTIEGARRKLGTLKVKEQTKSGQLDFSFKSANNQHLIDDLRRDLKEIIEILERPN